MDIFDVVFNNLRAIVKHPKILLPSLIVMIVGLTLGAAMGLSISPYVHTSASTLSSVVALFDRILPLFIITAAISFFVSIFVSGTYVDIAMNWKSKKISLSKSFKVSSSRYKDLLVYGIIVFIIQIVVTLVLLSPVIYYGWGIYTAYTNHVQVPAAIIGIFLIYLVIFGLIFLIAVLILSVMLFLGLTIVVVEKADPITALKKSVQIGKSSAVRIFAYFILCGIIFAGIIMIMILLEIIPLIGIVLGLAVEAVLVTFAQLEAPMYYLTYHKSRVY